MYHTWVGKHVASLIVLYLSDYYGASGLKGWDMYFGWQSWIWQFTWADCLLQWLSSCPLHWSRASDCFYLAARNWLHQTSIRTCIGWFYAGKGSRLYVWADQLLKTQFWFTMQTQGDRGWAGIIRHKMLKNRYVQLCLSCAFVTPLKAWDLKRQGWD
ncbi:hypothetical protein Hanom_Chr12g01083491 [Helianthus anomalus]